MKKINTLLVALLITNISIAQVTDTEIAAEKQVSFKSLHGHEVLPQKGEWALGISASGFFNYLGNIANNTVNNNAPTFNTANSANAFAIGQLNGVALMGKYMKRADLAYRVRFMANAGVTDFRNTVLKSVPTPDPLDPSFTEDKLSMASSSFLVGAGFEKRRGQGRLQGIYGAELLAGVAGGRNTYTYGNAFETLYTTPLSTTGFGTGTSSYASTRTLENKTGTMFLVGARAFAGVEYFIAPKISLGGELGYTLGFSTHGKGSQTTELWNAPAATRNTVTTENYTNSGLRSWGVGMDNVNAGINLHFYF